jgi:hypothetical protein
MVETQVAGLMKMPVGFMNICIQAALTSMKLKGPMERTVPSGKIPHSRFTTTPSSIFETAGITLKQAQVLEYLFLVSQATYRGIAHQFDTLPINVGRSVGALLRRGMARRIGEQAVTVDRAGWRLRVSYAGTRSVSPVGGGELL